MLSKAQQAKIDEQTQFLPKIVDASDAPVLSEAWLLEEDSHIVCVEVQLISSKTLKLEKHQIGVIKGLTTLHQIFIEEAVDVFPIGEHVLKQDYTPTADENIQLEKRGNARRRATLSQAIIDPKTEAPIFSYGGEGGRIPIEGRSEALVKELYDAYQMVNVPGKQVQFLNRFQEVGRDPEGETESSDDASDG